MGKLVIKVKNAKSVDIDAIFKLWVESMKFHEKFDSLTFGFLDSDHAGSCVLYTNRDTV